MSHKLAAILIALCLFGPGARSQAPANAAGPAMMDNHDGSHDFDFLIGDWKAHVRRLPDRLNHSTAWDTYEGISNHHKLLDTNANFEQFEVDNPARHLHIKGQTLRMYNPETHQWSIWGLDLDDGQINAAPVVGGFHGKHGEFFDQEQFKGRTILVRYIWEDVSPHAAHMDQSWSPDGGRTWEMNWVCDLTR